MTFSIALSKNNLKEVLDLQWDNFSNSISPDLKFLSRDWYSAWECNHLVREHPTSRIEYLSLFDDENNLRGTFPYVKHSKLGLSILSVAGLYYPFRSILLSSEVEAEGAQAFVDKIHKSHRNSIVRIGPAVEDELANRMINESFLALGWKCYEIYCGETLLAELPDTIDEYYSSLSKKFTKNLQRRKANLNKLGEVKFNRFNNCDGDIWDSVIEQCASIEKRSWLAAGDDAEMRIHENREFWKQYLRSKDGSKRVVVWMITLDGKPISFSFTINSGDCRYSFSSHYDEEYKKYGLGIIAYSCTFEDAIKDGIKMVNMGTGEAEYKARLGAKIDSKIIDYVYLPPTLIGRSIYTGLNIRNKLRSYRNFISS